MVRVSKNIEFIKDKADKEFIKTNSIITEYNESLENINDFVIEQGTKDIWIYRKWNSGILELFCSIETNKFTITSGDYKEYLVSFPFKFINIPYVMIGVPTSSSSAHYGLTNGRASELNTTSCRLTHNAGQLPNIWVSAHFVGRWK